MNILKAISKERLVILVTHEKDIAKFYSSRIIELLDGKIISDEENDHNDDLDYKMENNIYLKEFENCNMFKSEKTNITLYSDSKEELNIKVVIKNGNVYVQANENKIEVVDETSSIKLVDGVYKKISKEEHEKYEFDFEKHINNKYKMKYTSIYNIFNILLEGFRKVSNYSVIKKIMLLRICIFSYVCTLCSK